MKIWTRKEAFLKRGEYQKMGLLNDGKRTWKLAPTTLIRKMKGAVHD